MKKGLIIFIVIASSLAALFFIIKNIIKNKLLIVDVKYDKLNKLEGNNANINLKISINNKTPYNFIIKDIKASVYYEGKMIGTAIFGDIKSKKKSQVVLYKDVNVLLNEQLTNLIVDTIGKKQSDISYKASLKVFNYPLYIKGKI